MTRLIAYMRAGTRRWCTDESGTMVVDFALMFTLFMTLMLSSIDMGFMTFRQTMLERGLDLAVRDLRLGFGGTPTHATIKESICDYAGFLPDCDNSLRLEMQPMDLRAYSTLTNGADCVDKSEEISPVRTFVNGGDNEIMILRACFVSKPLFAAFGLGMMVEKDGNGDYHLYSTTAFVNEPS
ncbi:TadE/TadG family type IV pilus assembly protein [Pseudooceanicola sp. C21-150M6]|uniref:TadE/TadG family type IV pilus assembly protein n=1 Tax=Pseudooceanicola sp. C21-150M6 TaxID=3434355 RepID=UPI003D7FC278